MKVKDMQAVWSTGKDDWGTPRALFQKLHDEFNFCVDVCANKENALLDQWIGPGAKYENALGEWKYACELPHSAKRFYTHSYFMNPPYSNVAEFMQRMAIEADTNKSSRYVALVAARTDTRWFHDYVMHRASEVRFIKGRVQFAGAPSSAPFPSMIILYNVPVDSGWGTGVDDTIMRSWSYR